MAGKAHDPETLRATIAAVREHGGIAAAARALGMPVNTLHNRYHAALSRVDTPSPGRAALDDSLQDQLRELKARLASAERDSLTDDYVRRKIIGLSEQPVDPPQWLVRKPAASGGLAVPTLLASDWHWGEVVDPKQINGVNEFNLAVGQRRARRMIERTVDLLTNHIRGGKYPGIVFALGGDMMSGDIHDELSESNEKPVMPALLDLLGVLTWCIEQLADAFGNVFVPCVTGNHGRNTKKPRAKGRNYSNFDWLLYQFLSRQFRGDKRVVFHIPDGSDAHWSVFGHRYCLTHGDQFRGGDGMIGALGPIIRGDHKKRSRNGQIDLGYDTLLLGHWHQLIQLQRLIVNGSLKGYDEYAAANNFGYEIPQQALWLTHASHGITLSMPVHLDERHKVADKEWIKWAA
ncbi:MAG: hypothetical protein Q8K24_08935 [Hydrogenophaga sp.]|nr:hypothetical protein [Hydrogenophaga sp.]